MEKMLDKIDELFIRAKLGFSNLLNKEDGDTNFVSIALILVIVVAAAGIIYLLVTQAANTANNKVQNWMANPGK